MTRHRGGAGPTGTQGSGRTRAWLRASRIDVEAVLFFIAAAYVLWLWSTVPS